MYIEYSKAGSLHLVSGDEGRIENSTGALESDFSVITKELSKKIEPVKNLIHVESADIKPVILSFAENNNQRSAYVMFSNFSRFPNINRNYDRTEFYIGRDDISSWLYYFTCEYKTTEVFEKNYKANPINIRNISYNQLDIFPLISKLSLNSFVKLSKAECINLIGSLPSNYYQYLSFAIDGTEEICKVLNIVFLIGDSSDIQQETSNSNLNNKELLKLLDEYLRYKSCISLKELASLHLKLDAQYSNENYSLQNKSLLLELFELTDDISIKEHLLTRLIDLNTFASNFNRLYEIKPNIVKSKYIIELLGTIKINFQNEIEKNERKDKNRRNDAKILKDNLIHILNYNNDSPNIIKEIYQELNIEIAISFLNDKDKGIGFTKKTGFEIYEILKNPSSNLINQELYIETLHRLENKLRIQPLTKQKKNSILEKGKDENGRLIDPYTSNLLISRPSNETFGLFLYLFSVSATFNFLIELSEKDIRKYKNEIVNWLERNDDSLQKYYGNLYDKLMKNTKYKFYFNNETKIKEREEKEENAKQFKKEKIKTEIAECKNRYIIDQLEKNPLILLEVLNDEYVFQSFQNNKNIKFNFELGFAFYKIYDNNKGNFTSVFHKIDSKYHLFKNDNDNPYDQKNNKTFQNSLFTIMENFNKFKKINKVILIIGIFLSVMGIGSMTFQLINSDRVRKYPVDPPVYDSTVIVDNDTQFVTKFIGNVSFKYKKPDQSIILNTLSSDSSINMVVRSKYSDLEIIDTTFTQIFFSPRTPLKFTLFFQNIKGIYNEKYLEVEKKNNIWKTSVLIGKPNVYTFNEYKNDSIKKVKVVLEP